MTKETTSNKRIAKNTMYLYLRMLVIMLVTLYTSRIVLQELGVDDYGVYMVVGGVVSLFSFLNNSMTASTQRYLNYEMGGAGHDSPRLRTIFSTSLTIHLCIAAAVVILCETIGLWFVNTQLVVPGGKMTATNIVYQTTVLGFCITIMRVPFNAAIIAHERMGIYAVMSLAEAVLQLGCAFLLVAIAGGSRLAIYGCLVLGVQFLIATGYTWICMRRFKECTLKPARDPKLFREMSGFAGWNMLGSIAWVARGQGAGLILNVFFGPALNAAKGIADQVTHAVHSLTTNFMTAVNPQLTKSYASGRIDEMELLAYRGIKFSCMLIWILALPIIISVDSILSIWLTTVPAYAPLFLVLILIDCFAGTLFGNPLMTSMSATGRIRNYQIAVSVILMLVIPGAYIAFRCGLVPETIFYLNIIFTLAAGVVRLWFCHRQIGFSWGYYFRYAFLSTMAMAVTSTAFAFALKHLLLVTVHPDRIVMLIILTFGSLAGALGATWVFGLTRGERSKVSGLIRQKLFKTKSIS